jgi:hypothetical protein
MAVLKIPTGAGQLLYCEQTSWTTIGTPNLAIEAFDIVFKPGREIVPINVQSVWPNRGPKAVIAGAQGGTLTFKTVMRGGNGAESPTSKLLKNSGYTRTTHADKAAVVTGATSSTLIALTAGFSDVNVNDMVLVKGGSTAAQIRMVTRKQLLTPDGTHTTLSVAPQFSATPIAGDTLYAMDTFVPSQGEPTKYLAFYYYPGAYASAGTSPYYLIQGCAGVCKMGTTKTGGVPYLEWTFQVDAWSYVNAAAPALTVDAFAAVHALLGDPLTIDNAAVAVADFGFDPGMVLNPYTSTAGTNGRAGWMYSANDPKLDFTPYFDNDWISTKFSSAGNFSVLMESIKSQTQAWAVWAPKCYATDVALADAGNGHLASKPTCLLADPGLDGGGTINLARFAIGIAGVGT